MSVDPDRPLAQVIATGTPDDPMHAAWYNRGVADARAHLLSAEEAGEQLDVSAHTVRRYAREGKIGCVRMHDSDAAPVKFRQAHVDAFIEANDIPARTDEDTGQHVKRQRPRHRPSEVGHLAPRRERQSA